MIWMDFIREKETTNFKLGSLIYANIFIEGEIFFHLVSIICSSSKNSSSSGSSSSIDLFPITFSCSCKKFWVFSEHDEKEVKRQLLQTQSPASSASATSAASAASATAYSTIGFSEVYRLTKLAFFRKRGDFLDICKSCYYASLFGKFQKIDVGKTRINVYNKNFEWRKLRLNVEKMYLVEYMDTITYDFLIFLNHYAKAGNNYFILHQSNKIGTFSTRLRIDHILSTYKVFEIAPREGNKSLTYLMERELRIHDALVVLKRGQTFCHDFIHYNCQFPVGYIDEGKLKSKDLFYFLLFLFFALIFYTFSLFK